MRNKMLIVFVLFLFSIISLIINLNGKLQKAVNVNKELLINENKTNKILPSVLNTIDYFI